MILDTIREMKVALENKINNELARLDAHVNDGIKSPQVCSFLVGSQKLGTYGFPAILITPEGLSQGEFTGGVKDVFYQFRISCAVEHTDAVIAENLLYRLLRAVENVLENSDKASSYFQRYETQSVDFQDSEFQIDDAKTQKDGAIIAIVNERLLAYRDDQI